VLLKNIFNVEDTSTIKEYVLTDEDWVRVEELRSKYFNNPDWNYGKNPKFEFKQSKRTPAGQIEFSLNVEKNAIKDIKINGDFFGLGEISDVEKALVGVGYNREDLTKAFEAIDICRYFGNVTVDILVNLLLGVEE